MVVNVFQDASEGSGMSTVSVVDQGGDDVTSVGEAEIGNGMSDYPVSEPFPEDFNWPDDYEWPVELMWPQLGSAAAGDERPGEPDEVWSEEPDAYYREIIDYMRRLYAHCQNSDEFVTALKSLFPDLEEKIAKEKAMATEELDNDDQSDPDADIAAGRSVIFLSGAEMFAADVATLSDPVVCD